MAFTGVILETGDIFENQKQNCDFRAFIGLRTFGWLHSGRTNTARTVCAIYGDPGDGLQLFFKIR